MGQLAKQIIDHKGGSLFANTQVNLKEQCKAIITGSDNKVWVK